MFGRSQRAQAQLIIEHAAHPDAREELHEHAALPGLRASSSAIET
jgi:acyl-CoA hydrolase